MRKKHFAFRAQISAMLVLALILSGSVGTIADAQSDAISNAVSYLNSQSNSPEKVMALMSAGENSSINFLKSFSGSDAISYTKPILAITSVGEDPRTFPDENFVQKLQSFAEDGQIGSVQAINDDAWGILALRSAGVSADDAFLQSAKQFILDNQNPDGGWAWNVGGTSTADDTSAVVMALLEMGISKNDSVISNAISFIKENQNDDGGFASNLNESWGSDSNTSTTSWVVAMVNKLGENPTSWTSGENNPIDFMLSLQDEDGGFWWVEPESSEWNNKAPTADVVIAITGETFPINEIVPQENEEESDEDDSQDENDGDENENSSLATLRIEGSASQVCKTKIESETALSIVEDGADVCGYTYEIVGASFGQYLKSINDDVGEGLDGWLYFVNWESPNTGAGNYELESGDSVLWYYGAWDWKPLKITLDNGNSYSEGELISGKVEAIEDGAWSPVEEAEIKFNGEIFFSESNGTFSIEVSKNGVFEMFAEKDGFIRSDKVTIVSGDTASNSVSLSVTVVEEEVEDNPEIGFTLSQNSFSFGTVSPGQIRNGEIGVENIGLKDLELEAEVKGDQVFHLLKIEGVIWSSFQSLLNAGSKKSLGLSLQIPSSFDSFGAKAGELIIWGSATE